jgi:L-iditol 2-dehydrogenase
MLALVKTQKGVGNLELRDVPTPRIENNEVLIEIKAAGICGTDIHIKHDRFPYWPPVILGHEYSGIIIDIGKGVKNYKIGDRIVGEPHTKACGMCYLCRTGNIQICAQKRSPGWGIDGAFTKYLKAPEHLLHKIPDSIDFEEAALIEPVSNVTHDVLERAKIEPEDFVVIFGPGPIGLLAAQIAKAAGARFVCLLGINNDEEIRLKVARGLNIDLVINIEKEDPYNKILELTNNIGADLVVEASGSEQAIGTGIKLLRKKGRFCVIGMNPNQEIKFPWNQAIFKSLDIFFCISTSYTSWEKSISLMARNAINVKKIISHIEPLTNWEKAFNLIEDQKALKVILIP